MISYELIQKLHVNGFPEIGKKMYWCTDLKEWTYSESCRGYENATCNDHQACFLPSMRDLLEVLGNKFFRLDYENGCFSAMTTPEIVYNSGGWYVDKSKDPEVALMNLFLELVRIKMWSDKKV